MSVTAPPPQVSLFSDLSFLMSVDVAMFSGGGAAIDNTILSVMPALPPSQLPDSGI